jgi:hypothetical protein
MTFLICCCICFASILWEMFAFMFIKETGLYFSFFFCGLYPFGDEYNTYFFFFLSDSFKFSLYLFFKILKVHHYAIYLWSLCFLI